MDDENTMNDIKFNCSACNQPLEAPPEMAGQMVACPKCQTPIEIPVPSRGETTEQKRPTVLRKAPPTPPSPLLPQPAKATSPKLFLAVVLLSVVCVGLSGGMFYVIRGKPDKPDILIKFRHDMPLDGEVFIVTEGAQNIKLGLVEVGLIPMADVDKCLEAKREETRAARGQIEAAVASAYGEMKRLEELARVSQAEGQATAIRVAEAAIRKDARKQSIALMNEELTGMRVVGDQKVWIGHMATGNRAVVLMTELNQAREEERKERVEDPVGAEEKARHAAEEAQSAQETYAELTDKALSYRSGAPYMDDLTNLIRRTKTNADGKFRMEVPASGVFALAAQATRHVGEKVERYYWLLRLPEGHEKTVTLSNDNMSTTQCPDNLLATETVIKSKGGAGL